MQRHKQGCLILGLGCAFSWTMITWTTSCKVTETSDTRTMRASQQLPPPPGGFNMPPPGTTDPYGDQNFLGVPTTSVTPTPSATPIATATVTTTPPPPPTAYPQMEYYASGTIYHYNGDSDLRTESRVNMTADTVVFEAVSFDSKQKEVREAMAGSVGAHTFTKVSPADLIVREREGGFVNDGYLMFARRVLTKKGDLFRFSNFLPIFVMPVDKSRYRNLVVGQPINYNADVVGTSTTGGINFGIVATISKISENDQEAKIKIEYTIPADDKGKLYERWPIPKSMIYTVNFGQKLVTTMDSSALYYESKKNAARGIVLTARLCKQTLNGAVTTYPCR